jgi:CCR4-NOT transcriptional regulation complex NOT5 subunit
MKKEKVAFIGIICFALISCGTLGIDLGEIFSPAQSNSTSNTQGDSATPLSTNQPSRNTDRRADPDAANWDIAALDTAADVDYLTAIEKDVILEMNKVRTNPRKYEQLYIQPLLRYYSGRYYSVP